MKSKTRKPSSSPDLGERLSMTEWRKHYVSTVTAEDDMFPQRESGTNLGRIFVLLLLLHVFIIGAVVLYNIVAPKAPLASRTDGKPQTLNKSVAKTETASTAAKAVTAAPTAKPAEQPAAQKLAPAVAKIDPPAAPKPAPKPVENLLTYEVKSGDNVPGIASALGVNPEDLVKLNNLDNSELYPGRKLVYRNPVASASTSETPAAPTPPKLQPAILNTVTTPKPKTEPLKLVVPPKERTEDGPPKVAVKVNVPDASPDEVPHAVPVKSMSNVEDQPPPAKPKVKNNTEDAPPAKPKSESKSKNDDKRKSSKSESKTASKSDKDKSESKKSDKASGKKTHIVGAHETLYSISRKFGVSVSALQKANNIKDPTLLRDGSKLVIPSKN